MDIKHIQRVAAKAKLLGIKTIELNKHGVVICGEGTNDVMYLAYKNKPIHISRELAIPSYICINNIIIVRHIKETPLGNMYGMLDFYFPVAGRQFSLVELPLITSFELDKVDKRLPNPRFKIHCEDGSSAVILKIMQPTKVVQGVKFTTTYVISELGYRKQVSSKYVSVANAGWDDNYNRRLVLLQLGRDGRPFENPDKLNEVDRVYLENNNINVTFTRFKLLSPSNRLVSRF